MFPGQRSSKSAESAVLLLVCLKEATMSHPLVCGLPFGGHEVVFCPLPSGVANNRQWKVGKVSKKSHYMISHTDVQVNYVNL